MVLKIRVQILRLVLVIHHQRYGPYERIAGIEYICAAVSVLIELQPVMKLHPSRDALIISGSEVDAVPESCICHTLTAACIPYSRIRHSVYASALQPGMLMLYPCYLCKLLIRRPLDAFIRSLGASVQLKEPVHNSFIVYCPPSNGEWLPVSEVITPEYSPSGLISYCDIEWLDDMTPPAFLLQQLRVIIAAGLMCFGKIMYKADVLEELSFVYIPIAVQPHVPEMRRKGFKVLYVIRILMHQSLVVIYGALYECIVIRILTFIKLPVYE